jgi:predicted permease
MTTFVADLRFSLRALRRNPLVTSIAVLSLALGIGANTAIFTLMDQLMLRRLPVKDPGSLVMLYQEGTHPGSNMGRWMHSYPMYQDFQQKAAPFSETLCRREIDTSLSADNQTERVDAEMVSGNYFTMLGVKPAVGRLFNSREDDRVFGGHPVVTLSYDYWADRFARNPNVVGKKILVNNYPMTIVGVSERGFAGIDPSRSPQIRTPILMEKAMAPSWDWFSPGSRRARWVQVFARLKPGYTAKSAAAPLQTLFRQIREYESTLPEAGKWSPYIRDRFLRGVIRIEPAATGYSHLRNRFSTALIVLMSMVGLVLLIACANVANLLIARAMARQKEIAVRLSLGASRARLVRQLLTESAVLSLAGGVAGVGLAVALTRGLLALTPSDGNPLLIRAEPDWRVLLFTLALTAATGIVFGLAPALRASRPDLWTTLKDAVGSIAGKGGSLLLRRSLVAAQVALSFLLLFGAGLFVRSLENLKEADTGFRDMDNLVTFQLAPAMNGYDAPRTVQFYRELLGRLRAVPGVRSAGMAAVALLSGDEWDNTISVEGHRAKDGENMQAFMNALSPGYFRTMGIPLLEGRDFDERDVKDDATVCIVNEQFARHYFGDKSAIGRRVGFGGGPGTKLSIEIVGVSANTLYEGPREGVRRQMFVPHWGNDGVAFYVRAGLGSKAAYAALRNEVRNLDSSMPVYRLTTLAGQLDDILMTERMTAALSAGFGLLATLLAAVGLYGVMAFVVARRTREMGLRMALGAQPGSVVRLVMREVLTLLAIGLVVGVPSGLALGRLVASQLYGVQGSDPATAAVSAALLIAVAGAAGWVPARRASRIDPILALRYE